jgi:putative glutamine transport system substrate-binding protein
MKMKNLKYLFLGIVLLLGFVVAGCSQQAQKPQESSAIPSDIKAIKDRGVLNVGVKYDVPKFGFKDPKTGKIEGFEIDIAHEMAKKILGDPEKVNLIAVTPKTRGPLLDNGEVDMVIATFTITPEREKSFNFSIPYFTDGVALLVKKDSGIKSFADLNGKTVGVAQSATTKGAIEAEAKAKGIKVNVLEFASYPEIKAALESGRVQAFSTDGAILYGYLDDSTMLLPERFAPQNYGIAMKKGNDGLLKLVNSTLEDMQKDGSLAKLKEKWGLK